jgi:hypothetical protein
LLFSFATNYLNLNLFIDYFICVRYYGRFLSVHNWFFPGIVFSILHYVNLHVLVLGPGVLLYLVDLYLRYLYSWLEPKVVARRLIGYEFIEIDIQFHGMFFFYEKNAVLLEKVTMQLFKPSSWYYVCIPEVRFYVHQA